VQILSLTLGPYKSSKEEGFHRRQREGRHFNNGAEWGDAEIYLWFTFLNMKGKGGGYRKVKEKKG
jgi:hypothetical protein